MSTRPFAAVLAVSLGLCAGAPAAQTLGAAGCDPGERRLRFAHGAAATGHPIGEAAGRFSDVVNRDLDGRVCVEVFSGGALASGAAALAALQSGEAELAAPPVAAFERLAPALAIFDLPFLFADREAAQWFQRSGPGQRLKRAVGGGLQGMAFWNAGMRQIAAERPLRRPGDLAGAAFADQGGALSGPALERLGARPAPTPLAAALERGAVDALEAGWARLDDEGLALRLGGATETNHALAVHVVTTSAAFWDGLPLNDRLALSQILARITAQSAETSARLARRHRQAILAAGAPIHELSAEDRAAWEAAFEPYWRAAAQRIGPRFLDEALIARR